MDMEEKAILFNNAVTHFLKELPEQQLIIDQFCKDSEYDSEEFRAFILGYMAKGSITEPNH